MNEMHSPKIPLNRISGDYPATPDSILSKKGEEEINQIRLLKFQTKLMKDLKSPRTTYDNISVRSKSIPATPSIYGMTPNKDIAARQSDPLPEGDTIDENMFFNTSSGNKRRETIKWSELFDTLAYRN